MMKMFTTFLTLLCLSVLSLGANDASVDGGFAFKKIFFVLLENQPLHVAMDDPAMSSLASKGTLFTNLNAMVNPSQPNYIALVSGDMLGVTGDENYDLNSRFLGDLMEEKNVSWKAYQENYPGKCFTGDTSDGLYKRKHNPFMSFDQVRKNSTLCSKIVNADQLWQDIIDDNMPQYSFYTPNMNNNGHDTGMRYAASWLDGFIHPLLVEPNFMKDMLVVITFDEGVRGDNVIYTLFLGNDIPAGYIDQSEYSLVSLLRLVQNQFSLPTLGRKDVTANQIKKSNAQRGVYGTGGKISTIAPAQSASSPVAAAQPTPTDTQVAPNDNNNNTNKQQHKSGHYINTRRIVIVAVSATVGAAAFAGLAFFVYRRLNVENLSVSRKPVDSDESSDNSV